MPVYANIDGDSGVASYEIGANFITVFFRGTARSYTYSYSSAGREHVEEMKRLAEIGDGLNSYINRFVKYRYERC